MNNQNLWYNQDKFWEFFEPFLFDGKQQKSAKAEAENVIELLNMELGYRVLDLCCGTGRHSLYLSSRGFDVVGIDRTTSFVEKARRKAKQQHLKVEFIVSDMLDYYQPNSFNVVINLFGSFGYFDNPNDDLKVVKNMYASLHPGGQFLIETMGKEILKREFQEKDWHEEGDTIVLTEKKPIDNWLRMQTRWIVIKNNQKVEHTVSVRCYSAVELSSLLSEGGFSKVEIYGDLEGHEYNHDAKRLIVIGYK